MRAKLNDVVLVEWTDAEVEKAVIVRGEKGKTEYEVFFPQRKRDRIAWIGSDQVKKVVGSFNLEEVLDEVLDFSCSTCLEGKKGICLLTGAEISDKGICDDYEGTGL